MTMKKKILILNGQYLPGFKGGGPIQSCVNMVENLSHEFEFYVLTADRDFKSMKQYDNIMINSWNQVGAAKVFYMSPDMQTFKGFKKILNETEYDLLYLNGFFSPIFTIKPLILKKLGLLHKEKIILTPRGDFTGGTKKKKIKKYIYIYLCKLIGLYNNLIWHATSELEAKDIEAKFKKANIFTVSNLPAKFTLKPSELIKKSGELRLVFISRISPKKNLNFALQILKSITKGNVIFDIYGPLEDKSYWKECQTIMKQMPTNVTVKYKGELPHLEVSKAFENYHAFFFPTLGENYGHVIVEAMVNNCLPILSKEVTPWDDYIEASGLGGELSSEQDFEKILIQLLNSDMKEFESIQDVSRRYINENFSGKTTIQYYIDRINKEI